MRIARWLRGRAGCIALLWILARTLTYMPPVMP